MSDRKGLIERYRDFLPVSDKTPVISLFEGNTPHIFAKNLSEEFGLNIFLKYEGLNPTGSFKDRGMTMAISKALEEGAKAVMCASTGNTSASAAAYATRAGIDCIVLIPEGKIALGKLSQALMHGAKVIAIKGNFDQALDIVRELTTKHPIVLVNSINPYRIQGQKTGAFEICDDLGDAPDYLFIPVGNGGNITAYWMGFKEYYQAGKSTKLPKMMGFQAEGAAPIVKGYPIKYPETIATAIRIGNPARWKEAEEAASSSGGKIDMVSDEEIISAYKMLALREGVFVEPASAASVAGLRKLVMEKKIEKGKTVVCVLTGHGLKDPDNAIKVSGKIIEAEAIVEAIEKIIL
ncbi:threonine synthase [Candidatus Oleimmundimicrobium sp.]|uniref:threonine synthase n=1 Tax=Candidatus Oleimmundimicrobium sp. TaxID=3060597 RepID=UPI002726DFAA|nr:threonine synthase [Candidatus Oleimmundimicrobium sp.]MDO8885527.1 threonine synthase [Candidatus Oleimmundimicrobium sp.]